MKKIEAFIVGSVEKLRLGRWAIAGRACEDVSIGDSLMYDLRSIDDDKKLEVLSITSYGREQITLYKMMTGWIVVGGQKVDILESVKMLYK